MQPLIDGKPPLGCTYLGEQRARFLVWAPRRRRVDVCLAGPPQRAVAMNAKEGGYFQVTVEGVPPGAKYLYRLDGDIERPDPASRLQPDSVHGPSEVVVHDPRWEVDAYRGRPLRDYIIYEVHVGTFTPAGTFEAAVERLDHLVALGITAVELMPVAAFPGRRNWGYDGVYPFAVETSYGGPNGLKAFIRACHQRDLAVILDVVYNHLGPEGNYLNDFGPYFTDKYQTPWGMAVNFDGDGSDEVRRYFLQNAAQWIDEFHVDALRLDAVHAIFDDTPLTFLEELRVLVDARERHHNRRIHLIAETHANDPRLVGAPERGGIGMDSHWSDDFHHAVHTLITGEQQDYYCDYGTVEHLGRCLRDGYSYTGQYSKFRGRRHGLPPRRIRGECFVVCVQNHDQVGNRPQGRRLSQLASFEQQKLAATALLCAPFVPLLFMGEEFGELAPFPYFVNHGDIDLVDAVRRGRRAEFASLQGGAEPPDPAAEATYQSAKIDWSLMQQSPHNRLLELYRELIRLRRSLQPLRHLRREQSEVSTWPKVDALAIRRWYAGRQVLILLNFDEENVSVELGLPEKAWQKRLETCAEQWGGRGARLPARVGTERDKPARFELSGHSAALYDALPAVED